MPGYMPESDPATFDDFASAARYLADEIDRVVDMFDDTASVDQDAEHDCDDIPCPTYGDACAYTQARNAENERDALRLLAENVDAVTLADGWSGYAGDCAYWINACYDAPCIGREIEAEIGTTGEYATVELTASLAADVADAVRLEHPCGGDDGACDIAYALENGFPLTAGYLLSGATETPLLDAVYAAHNANAHDAWTAPLIDDASVEGDTERSEADAWSAFAKDHGKLCDSCNGYTYGDDVEDIAFCGHCGADLRERFEIEDSRGDGEYGSADDFDTYADAVDDLHARQTELTEAGYTIEVGIASRDNLAAFRAQRLIEGSPVSHWEIVTVQIVKVQS
jgi:hypothetical protein